MANQLDKILDEHHRITEADPWSKDRNLQAKAQIKELMLELINSTEGTFESSTGIDYVRADKLIQRVEQL